MYDNITELQIGKAGEYLVCADLILSGYIAYPSEQGLRYDVVIDLGERLLRVQVKTTRKPQSIPQRKEHYQGYLFQARRMGKLGRGSYLSIDVDLFAFVALDTKTIGYMAETDVGQSMIFRVKEFQGNYYDERSVKQFAEIKELRDKGMSFKEIGKVLNLDGAYCHRVLNGAVNYTIKGRYLHEQTIDKALESYWDSKGYIQPMLPLK